MPLCTRAIDLCCVNGTQYQGTWAVKAPLLQGSDFCTGEYGDEKRCNKVFFTGADHFGEVCVFCAHPYNTLQGASSVVHW